jgi:hypothetical protein
MSTLKLFMPHFVGYAHLSVRFEFSGTPVTQALTYHDDAYHG